MLRSVLRNFSAFGAAFIVDRVITFLFLVYAARALGPGVFGQYLLIGTYVMFFSVTFTAGLLPVAVREIVRRRDDPLPILEQVLSLRLILGLLAYAMLMLITAFVLPAETFLPLAAIAGTSLVVDAFKDSFAAYHTAFERMVIPSAFQVAGGIFNAVIGTVLLFLDFGILALFAVGAVVNLLVTVMWHVLFSTRFQRYRIRLAFPAWKQMLIKVAPLAPLQLAIQFNRLASVMMLSLVGGPIPPERAVGYFGAAHQIASFPLGLLFGLRRAIVPPVSDKLHRGERIDEEFAVALKVAVVFLSFPLLVATSAFAREILVLVLGPGYVESALTLKLLGAAAAIWIAAIFPESFLISYPEQKFARFLAGAYIPLLINLLLCLVLIPTYGIAGAAFAILVARAVHLAYALHYCRALLPLHDQSLGRYLKTLSILSIAYIACLVAAHGIEQIASQAIAVLALAVAGMLAAGRGELAMMWRVAGR